MVFIDLQYWDSIHNPRSKCALMTILHVPFIIFRQHKVRWNVLNLYSSSLNSVLPGFMYSSFPSPLKAVVGVEASSTERFIKQGEGKAEFIWVANLEDTSWPLFLGTELCLGGAWVNHSFQNCVSKSRLSHNVLTNVCAVLTHVQSIKLSCSRGWKPTQKL